jgi:hypothetical protein
LKKLKDFLCTFEVQRFVFTDAAIRNKKPKARPYNATTGDGLFLYVQPGGAQYWRFAFCHLGKRKTLALGVYPDVSLTRARAHVAGGGHAPCALKKAAKAARVVQGQTTFEAVATAWMAAKSEKWNKSHVKEQRHRLEKDLLLLHRHRAHC